jgi:hypothetical protein
LQTAVVPDGAVFAAQIPDGTLVETPTDRLVEPPPFEAVSA